MAVYVDKSLYRFGNMIMCHMMADTLEELHTMADTVGVSRGHFQKKSVPHYDLCKSKRALALQHGAVEFESREQQVKLIRKLKKDDSKNG